MLGYYEINVALFAEKCTVNVDCTVASRKYSSSTVIAANSLNNDDAPIS